MLTKQYKESFPLKSPKTLDKRKQVRSAKKCPTSNPLLLQNVFVQFVSVDDGNVTQLVIYV